MIPVSDKWLQAQREVLVPESHVEIKYFITDPDVTSDMTLVDSGWTADPGYIWQSRTTGDENGLFSTPVVITMLATKVHKNVVPGMTLNWDTKFKEYPIMYNVAVYRDDKLVANKLVENNDSCYNTLQFDFSNFNKIVITVYNWSVRYRQCRVTEASVGIYVTYTKSDLMSFEHEQTCDILSGSLPKNAVTFKFDNSDSRWNPLNKKGLNKYMLERQELSIRYGYDIDGTVEWVDVGNFYLNEWSTPNNGLEASFTARDLIEFMNDEYVGIKEGTLYEICEAALEQANLPKFKDGGKRYFISDALKQFTTILDDAVYKIKEIVQLCANAGCCIVHQDHTGKIKIEGKSLLYSYYPVDDLINYEYPEISISKELRAIDVNRGLGYYAISNKGEVQTLDNDLILTPEHAEVVASWVGETLNQRNTISGSARLDPRLEVTDMITVQSKFETVHGVYVTDVKLTYNGAFRGTYKGRLFEFTAQPASYVGLPYSGEV